MTRPIACIPLGAIAPIALLLFGCSTTTVIDSTPTPQAPEVETPEQYRNWVNDTIDAFNELELTMKEILEDDDSLLIAGYRADEAEELQVESRVIRDDVRGKEPPPGYRVLHDYLNNAAIKYTLAMAEFHASLLEGDILIFFDAADLLASAREAVQSAVEQSARR